MARQVAGVGSTLGGPQTTKTFGRKVDAERWLVDVQHRLPSGTYTPPAAGQVTVAAYAAEWVARRTWAPATQDRIERELRLHILPRLGSRPLASLRRSHIEEWAKALPLAPSSADAVYRTLRALLGAAVEDDRIPRNPATGARVPEGDGAPFVPMGADDVRAVARGAAEHVRAAVVLAAGTGLRQGELFGLARDRVDFLRRELRVTSSSGHRLRGLPPYVRRSRSGPTGPLCSVTSCSMCCRRTWRLSGPAQRGCYPTSTDGLLGGHLRGPLCTGPPVRRGSGGAPGTTSATTTPATCCRSGSTRRRWLSGSHDLKTLLTTYAHVMPKDDDRVRSIVDATLAGSAEDWLRTEAV